MWNVADRLKNVLTDVSFAKIVESGDGGTGKFDERNSFVKILDKANEGGWLVSLNVIKIVPTNDLIVICTGEMMRQTELSPPEMKEIFFAAKQLQIPRRQDCGYTNWYRD